MEFHQGSQGSVRFWWETKIALHAMQGNQDSSPCKGEVSWIFSSCRGNLGYVLEFRRESNFKTRVSSGTSGLLSSCEEHSGFSSRHGRAVETPLKVRRETHSPFPVATVILGFLSIFKRSQALSPFEALILCGSRVFKGMQGLLSRWGKELVLSLWAPTWTNTSLPLVQWKTSLHSSHCREIWP